MSVVDRDAAMDELRAVLRENAAHVAEALLGPANRTLSTRNELRWGKKGSVVVQIAGPKRGLFHDHEADEGGDMMSLIQRERQCDFTAAAEWGAQIVGIHWTNGIGDGFDQTEFAQRQRERARKHAEHDAEPAADEQRRITAAQRIWQRCRQEIDGTVAETYLAEWRKIPKPAEGWPDALRFLPDRTVKINQLDANGNETTRTLATAGALVIAAKLPVHGVQSIYLKDDGDNLRRSNGTKIKLSHGVFNKGAVGLPGPADGPLLVAEGAETALSVWRATGFETHITHGSIAKLTPPTDRLIVVARDDDALDSPADRALAKTVAAWRETGAKVAIATPWPEPRDDSSDFNDAIKKGGVDAVKTRIDLALLHDPARILAAIEAVEPPTAAPKLLTEALLHVLWQSADFPESTREPLILAAAKRLQAATKLPRPPVKAVRNDTDRALREARDTQERREKTARERVRADQAKRQAEARRKQIATQRTTWPDGFEMRPDGFWFIPSDEQRGSPVWICGPFEVAGIAYSTANVEPSVYIRWTDENGVDHFPVLVARHFIHRPGNEIAETLERANLRCSPDALAHERLKKALGGVQSKNRLLIVSRTGWHDTKNGPVFVLPDQTFGPGGASVIMANATPPTIAIYGTKGTLEAWQNTVAKLATENDRLVLAISVPFGAPLLDMLAEPSGCIDLQGHSRIGKTTLLETTASVCGPPVGDDGQIITWRTTDNGLEGAAALRCDMAIPLDDTSKAGPDVLEQSVHMLSGGMSKQRANRDGTAQPRQFWRTLGFSTSNKTLAQRLAEIDKEPVGGMEARFSHVPADAHAGHGVYQNLHGRESGAALSQELHAAAMENYGTPIRAFLERLTNERAKNPDELLTALKDLHNAFMQKYVPVSADGQVISVACRFAVVAAGGELAIEFGQLPWQEGEALRGVGACFRAWLVARGNLGSVENRAIIAQVRHLIEPDGEGRFATFTRNDGPDDARARSVTRAGFRRRNAEGVWEYFVLPEVWRREYCRGHDPADVHDLMVKNGWSSWGADNRRSHRPYVPSEGNNVRSYFVSGANLGGDDDGVG